MKKITSLCIALLVTGVVHAQERTQSQYLYWIRYQNQIIFTPSLYWSNEADNRRFFGPDVQNQLIFHSLLHYKVRKWDFAGGLTYSFSFAQQPEVGYEHVMNEIRPVVETSFEQPVGKVSLQGRIRIDNRFTQVSPDESVLETSQYILRHRYRIQLRVPLKLNKDSIHTVGLRVADEVMFNHDKNTFDQHRIYVTGDLLITRRLSAELGYIYIYQQRLGRDEFFQRHVLRFSVLHKINTSSKYEVRSTKYK